MQAKPKMPKLRVVDFIETGWISNFWIRNHQVFFTDTTLQHQKHFLLKMDLNILLENLKNKNTWERKFIAHPSPMFSDPLALSNTDLQVENVFADYIFNLDENAQPILVTEEYLYLGSNQKFKFYKHLKLNQTFYWDQEFIPYKYNLKKIVNIKTETIFLTENKEIIYQDEIIYISPKNLMIANFDTKAFLVSDEATGELFYLNLDNLAEKNVIWKGAFFYRLECYDKKIIIGKPLTRDGEINFYLPIKFIF
ncbi:hypothetical protein [Williamsoniiplasma lucivorax]|uniref:Uncharacterized protein n=1 Tax=Williamsoniiplasma lucivorax TaxID=209274 RepID=A0A2S5RFS0_9MOLU|nr:hypothetical protein [Williamsoniiplasma lucivorax]PPE06150.1 hypothetical protein ELUCI_v1c04410 [Williamsoniiplasma lucivorax]